MGNYIGVVPSSRLLYTASRDGPSLRWVNGLRGRRDTGDDDTPDTTDYQILSQLVDIRTDVKTIKSIVVVWFLLGLVGAAVVVYDLAQSDCTGFGC